MPDIFESLLELKLLPRQLEAFSNKITSISPEDNFKQIKKLIDKLDQPTTPQPPPRSEFYLNQWLQFTQGKIACLDRGALKYLCWEKDLLDDSRFCDYLMQNVNIASARVIKGLVRSIHLTWIKDTPLRKIVLYTIGQVKSFSGRDRTLAKWKSDTNMILGAGGPALFGKNVLVNSHVEPKEAAEQWALGEYSAFMRYAIENAADQCLAYIGRNQNYTSYVIEILLSWNGWESNRNGLDFIVGKLILHDNVNSISDKLSTTILGHNLLGDPRLPANRNKWLGIDTKAKQRFISWLSRQDIVFFFDHVLKGKDRHGRREFWLKYVNQMVSSRPLLSDTTALLFRNIRGVNFGKLKSSTNQAAFLLDFGEILAIEFSDVGKIYIYKKSEFVKRIQDFWTNYHISENTLKDQKLPDERKIRHQALENIVYIDWRDNAASVLAREGIRP